MRRTLIAATLLFTTAALAGKPKPAPAPTAPEPAAEAPAPAPADDEKPMPVVKYRHMVMEATGEHMGALAMLIKEEVPRPKDAVFHAKALKGTAEYFCELFPEGSGPDAAPRTDAKAEIWTDAAGFTKACDDFKAATEALVEAAKGDDFAAVQDKFRGVGQSCGGCHDGYRKKDEH